MNNILVVDDDSSRVDWFVHNLEKQYDVRVAIDAAAALDQLRETKFDLAFIDHDMGPGMNGSELAAYMIKNAKRFKLPYRVWLHSSNRSGASNMESKFVSAKVRCFVRAYDDLAKSDHYFMQTVQMILTQPVL